MTYDRAVVKLDEAARRAPRTSPLFTPPPVVTPIVPTSRDAPPTWRYTTRRRPTDWMSRAGFDDAPGTAAQAASARRPRPAPSSARSGTRATSGSAARSTLPANFRAGDPQLLLHHDEDAEVYINGVLAVKVAGYTTDYDLVTLHAGARAALLRPGANAAGRPLPSEPAAASSSTSASWTSCRRERADRAPAAAQRVTPNVHTVRDRYSSPGRSTVDGKFG